MRNLIRKLTALSCAGCSWCSGSCYVTDPNGKQWPCIQCNPQ